MASSLADKESESERITLTGTHEKVFARIFTQSLFHGSSQQGNCSEVFVFLVVMGFQWLELHM